MNDELENKKNGNGSLTSYVTKLKKIIDSKPKKVAIFTHSNPDPDAIGSMMGLQFVFSKFEIESDLFYCGEFAHPQNQAMVNLLDPGLINCEKVDVNNYNIYALVDTVPNHAGTNDLNINFDLVIDHHKETVEADFKGIFINIKAGSACGTICALMYKLGLEFDQDVEFDSRVATALMIGIATDTDNLMSADSTDYEFQAWSKLFPYRNINALTKIINWERPAFWVDVEATAAKEAHITEGIAIVGLGIISKKHRDMIADMASQMVQWENVSTSICFAVVDGDRIEGSVRSKNASVNVSLTCNQLGQERFGKGGGKLGKGAYCYDLAGASITDDDDDETKQKAWDLFNNKERKRILRILKNGD
jgi:nanoRNase/pAp phosphatase (c-di-AMP/oligoRNAs hydrolase)